MDSLTGQLLISAGSLFDANFRHTVVLIGHHDGVSGAVGVILNRPLEITVAEAIPPLSELVVTGEALFGGGPVEPEQAVLLADLATPELVDVPVLGSIGFLTGDVPLHDPSLIRRARVYLGHAGWGPGQLEAELEEGAWVREPAREEDIFTVEPESLWRHVLLRKGPPWSAMARIPFDPSMN